MYVVDSLLPNRMRQAGLFAYGVRCGQSRPECRSGEGGKPASPSATRPLAEMHPLHETLFLVTLYV